ncbi:BED-type domain-containing protein [Citrus sinensis]|uniref:BED-type domain-containing protein n=1 Tax=Citrus sinensis TaxID=2711 RepID=A0ACB8JH82_CITSI|nr:BED-type domain-containing protein [Citrus sinensis]
MVTPSKPSVPHAHAHGFTPLIFGPHCSNRHSSLSPRHHSSSLLQMSNYSRVQDNLDCVADDFEHEVEVNDNENDSATIVTGGNKRKKSSSSKPPLPRKKMAPRSTVWQHFTRVPNDHTKCKCNYCGQEFECGTVGYGTSTLRTHNRERCQKFKDLQKSQTTLTQDVGSDGVVARGFSQEACRQATVKMIVLDELPFSVVENPGFRHFCSVTAPRYLLPSRRTISRDTLEMYLEEKAKLKSLLAGNKQRVSLTTDIWTSITTASYMVITAHFIDRDWNLHRKIISFNTVNDHSSETIGKQLEKCLIDWGIERVFTITVDNASPNEGALRYLIDRVKTWRDDGLVLNGDYLHVRCWAHILNLIVTEGLKELEQSIVSVQNAVKYVRSSTAREKINCRGSVILDCPTRWNSTYSMLNTALKFKPVFDRMALEDKLYDAYFNEKEGGKKKREGPPLYSDWENTRRIVNGSASGSASGSTSRSQNLASGSGSGSNFWDLGDDDDVMIEDPFSEFSKAVAVSEGSPELSNELDLYLMEKTEKIAKTRDVLAISVSTVASESAFSTGGRILDQYRSSLTPDMVEALVLLQNWLRTSLFVDTTADLNKLVEDNEFMDQLAEELRKSTTADQLCRST